MSTSPNRRPAGTPSGGQFAPSAHAESSASLLVRDEPPTLAADLGDVSNIQEGSRTPWGRADWVSHTAPGAVQVSTAGHGGIKLSPERNKTIPPALRNASGWYEEDCEAGIVAWVHPDACPQAGLSSAEVSESGRQTVVAYFPDEYEKATGEFVKLGQSYTRDSNIWRRAHANDEVAVSAIRSAKFSGFTEVTVRRGGSDPSTERVLMVPSDEYNNAANHHPLGRYAGSFVADPARHYADITPAAAPPEPPRPRYRGIDTSRLTPAQAYRANLELDYTRFRMPDGSAPTLREMVSAGGVTGKWRSTEYGSDGRARHTYYLSAPAEAEGADESDSTYALDVSKATWDAVDAPDNG